MCKNVTCEDWGGTILYPEAYLDTDTAQFPISHISTTSKDAVLTAAQSFAVFKYCLTIWAPHAAAT